MNLRAAIALGMLCLLSVTARGSDPSWSDPSPHRDGFVTANGIKLNYLDFGGSGPAMILIHGLGDNPHIFDDLAPGLTDRFHVIAYARRGHGLSDAKEPYDAATLTEDLRGLMDALGIARADLVGWSMGGNEITWMATRYPQRVGHIVYFDGLYDYADPDFARTYRAIPPELLETPPGVLASLDAYRAYQKAAAFAPLKDMRRVEAYMRQLIIQKPDGTVTTRMPQNLQEAMVRSLSANPPRDYTRVHCPALAFLAATPVDSQLASASLHKAVLAWERDEWAPFRAKSVARARHELTDLRVVTVPGAHADFFLVSRQRVLATMRQFLLTPPADPPAVPPANTTPASGKH